MENKGTLFSEAIDGEIKKLVVDNSAQRNTKKQKTNKQNIQERSTCVRLKKLFGGLQNN